jgi:hypothetical protein
MALKQENGAISDNSSVMSGQLWYDPSWASSTNLPKVEEGHRTLCSLAQKLPVSLILDNTKFLATYREYCSVKDQALGLCRYLLQEQAQHPKQITPRNTESYFPSLRHTSSFESFDCAPPGVQDTSSGGAKSRINEVWLRAVRDWMIRVENLRESCKKPLVEMYKSYIPVVTAPMVDQWMTNERYRLAISQRMPIAITKKVCLFVHQTLLIDFFV